MTAQQERLPDFEGEDVQQVQVRITNAGDGLSEALKIAPKTFHLGDEFFCVLRGSVSQINHKQNDDTGVIIRVHTVKASAITEVDGDMAKRILTAAADNLARAKAEMEGQLMLDQEHAAEEFEAEEAAKDRAIDERNAAAALPSDEDEKSQVDDEPYDDDQTGSQPQGGDHDAPTPIFSKGKKAQ